MSTFGIWSLPRYVLSLYENWLIFYKQAFFCTWIFPLKKWEVVAHSLSCVRLLATPWTAARQAFLSITNSKSLLKLMSIQSVMPSNHLILYCPLLLLLSVFSRITMFSIELTLFIRWPKYWSFSFSISPSSEYSGLISFRIDWFELLAVQGTLKSLLQHHSSKASIFQCSFTPRAKCAMFGSLNLVHCLFCK